MKLGAVAVVLVASSTAHAEAPIGVVASASVSRGSISPSDAGGTAVLALQADVGYRISTRAMIGAHVSAATGSDQVTDVFYVGGDSSVRVYNYRPVDAGVSVLVQLDTPMYFSAWFGAERSWKRRDCSPPSSFACDGSGWKRVDGTSPAFGFSIGYDIFRRDANRVSIVGSLETARETKHREFSYTSVGIGVAYRFWAR